MKQQVKFILAGTTLLASQAAFANWSSTVTLASDYSFNGVSYTDEDPALQASLDYAADSGWYAGAWTSNVDFGDGGGIDQELDFYAGYWTQLNDAWSLDYGIAYYTYLGTTNADESNYPEAWVKFNYTSDFGVTEFNSWYSWDYFGLGGGHVIGMVAHTFTIAENHAIRISADTSNSLDGDKWIWDVNDKSYQHVRAAYQTSFKGFNFEVAAEDTTLDYDTGDFRVVASVSRTFSF